MKIWMKMDKIFLNIFYISKVLNNKYSTYLIISFSALHKNIL